MSIKTLPVHTTTTTNNITISAKDQLIAQEEAEWLKKKDRFLTCKEALNRIMWDTDLNDAYQHLSMIYKDRFEGDTLISYEEFLNSDLAEELPQHRIQQLIYRDEFVFWGKKDRIDLLSNGQLRELIVKFKKEEEEQLAKEQAQFTTVLQPTVNSAPTDSKKKNKKNKKIMKEFARKQETVASSSQLSSTSSSSEGEEDDYEQYMDEYDENYSKYLKY